MAQAASAYPGRTGQAGRETGSPHRWSSEVVSLAIIGVCCAGGACGNPRARGIGSGDTAAMSSDAPRTAQGRALGHVAALSSGPPLEPRLRVTLNFHPDRPAQGKPILEALAEGGVYLAVRHRDEQWWTDRPPGRRPVAVGKPDLRWRLRQRGCSRAARLRRAELPPQAGRRGAALRFRAFPAHCRGAGADHVLLPGQLPGALGLRYGGLHGPDRTRPGR